MSDGGLDVFVPAFAATGFTPSISWYRNTDRNCHLLADLDPMIPQLTLVIYRDRDTVPRSPGRSTFVPCAEEVGLDCGHWVQQERPEETNRVILQWLERKATPAQ